MWVTDILGLHIWVAEILRLHMCGLLISKDYICVGYWYLKIAYMWVIDILRLYMCGNIVMWIFVSNL